jgi:hypothetical protein
VQDQRSDRIDHRLAGTPQAGEQHVAVKPVTALGHHLRHGFLQLGIGMVARTRDQLVAAHEIQPRIAAVSPVSCIALQHARHDRRARGVDERLLGRVADQLVMPGNHRIVEEAQRIGQHRLGVALEHRCQRLQRKLRRDLALRMPAHAIGQREQPRVPRVAVAHAVFVLLAAALAADLVDGEPHGAVLDQVRP